MRTSEVRPDIVDLLGPEFDRVGGEPAQRTLIVCAAPRTGSYELGRMLMAAGIGIAHEYFHSDFAAILAARWNLPANVLSSNHIGTYVAELRRRRSAGGVFATKLQYWQYVASLRNAHGRALFEGAVVVHLFRADATSQFVSWHRAQETGRYDFSEKLTNPAGSPAQLMERGHLLRMAQFLVSEDAGFRRVFIMSGIHPIFLEFDAFTKDPRSSIEHIGSALGVPLNYESLNMALVRTAPYRHSDSAVDRERLLADLLKDSAFES